MQLVLLVIILAYVITKLARD